MVFWDGEVKRAAGLAILVHRDFLSKWKVKGDVVSGMDWMSLTLAHSSTFRIVFVNIYLRQGVTYAVWADAKKFLLSLKPSLRSPAIVMGGDLNECLDSKNGRVKSSIAQRGSLDFLMVPYQPGVATNIVSKAGIMSMKEWDYVLTDVNSVLEFDQKLVLLGVSTHRAVVCFVTLPPSLAYARNVVGKLLDF